MKTKDFYFKLPKNKIAQHPVNKRDESKLLILNKKTGEIENTHFKNIINQLDKNDCLVMNNTKVIPARLIGNKEDTGGTVEILLLENEKDLWKCLTKPYKKVKVGQTIVFGNGLLKAKVLEKQQEGIILYEMLYEGIFLEILEELGQMPLPPYITEKLKDKTRYQTVYANIPGSAAAPTAGLHFTKSLINELKEKGVNIIEVTLHVGLDTFRPVQVDDLKNHKMHSERYYISKEAEVKLNKSIKENKRIIAVGTTTVRVLESSYSNNFKEGFYKTDIFIYPGYKFKITDAIITNFHLPESTLVMLVSAFSKKEYILNAYSYAINYDYRFFSFGDAMFIK